jgi:signal peptidase I
MANIGAELPLYASYCVHTLLAPAIGCSQVVVVLSGSMEPGMFRGDILFLNMGKAPIRTGEIVVFTIDGRDIPIVHRVMRVSHT